MIRMKFEKLKTGEIVKARRLKNCAPPWPPSKKQEQEAIQQWKNIAGFSNKTEYPALWMCVCGWWDDLPGAKPHRCQKCGKDMEIQSRLQALNWLTILLNMERQKTAEFFRPMQPCCPETYEKC